MLCLGGRRAVSVSWTAGGFEALGEPLRADDAASCTSHLEKAAPTTPAVPWRCVHALVWSLFTSRGNDSARLAGVMQRFDAELLPLHDRAVRHAVRGEDVIAVPPAHSVWWSYCRKLARAMWSRGCMSSIISCCTPALVAVAHLPLLRRDHALILRRCLRMEMDYRGLNRCAMWPGRWRRGVLS